MQKAIHPLRYIAITQGENGSYSHQGTKAIDYGWRDEDSKSCHVPYDCVVKNIYNPESNPLNTLWLESKEPVLYADGTIDYMTMLIQEGICTVNTYVGSEFHQGDIFYKMGSHVHIEIGKGRYVPNGWKWVGTQYGIANSYHQANALFLDRNAEINDGYGYNWKVEQDDYVGTPVPRDTTKDQIEVLVDNLRCRELGILTASVLGFANKGIYNILSKNEADGYVWYEIEQGKWVAYQPDWENLYEKEEDQKMIEELKTKIDVLEKENQELIDKNNSLLQENNNLKNQKEDSALIFDCKQDDTYFIELLKNEKLYLKK